MFEYHGAEHKVVFNFESGQPVNVENAQKFVTLHPRCGTSFLLVVMVVAILVYPLLPFDGFVAKLVSRIALLPLIIGVSYELIRYAAKHRRVSWPRSPRPACGCSASPPSRRPTIRPRSPSMRSKAPWSWKRRRAANWSSPNAIELAETLPCNIPKDSTTSKRGLKS